MARTILACFKAFGATAVILAISSLGAVKLEFWIKGDEAFSMPYPVFLFHGMFYSGVVCGGILGAALALLFLGLLLRDSGPRSP